MSETGSNSMSQDRLERAHHILDATSELLLRWGYNKTTIEDIAQHADVGKGTIYLHWTSRDALFSSLIRREQVELAKDFQQRIKGDPEGARLGNLIRHTVLALMQRPLLKALFLGDVAVWGKLIKREQSNAVFTEKLNGFVHYLDFLRERDLVRDDLSVRAQVNILAAITMGFFTVAPTVPREYAMSEEELGDLIAETVRASLEPHRPLSANELEEATRAFLQYAQHVADLLNEQLQQELAG